MELRGKYVMLSEGARGSLAKQIIANYKLDKNADYPKFGLGMKEIWEIDPSNHKLGHVEHSLGWPLGGEAGGGSFIYHLEDNQVYVGFTVHLDYKNLMCSRTWLSNNSSTTHRWLNYWKAVDARHMVHA